MATLLNLGWKCVEILSCLVDEKTRKMLRNSNSIDRVIDVSPQSLANVEFEHVHFRMPLCCINWKIVR